MKNGCIILGSNSQLTSYLWYLVLAAASTESKQPSNQPSNQEKTRMLNELIHSLLFLLLPSYSYQSVRVLINQIQHPSKFKKSRHPNPHQHPRVSAGHQPHTHGLPPLPPTPFLDGWKRGRCDGRSFFASRYDGLRWQTVLNVQCQSIGDSGDVQSCGQVE